MASRTSALITRPATTERWADLEELFGDRGACGGCWCMAWRLSRTDYESGKGAKHKRRLKRLVGRTVPPGVLGYAGGKAIAWCAVAPREQYSFLSRSRVLKPVDEQPVWSVSCLFVERSHRRGGVSTAILKAAVDFAAGHGARVVEGYPVEPTKGAIPPAFAWTGLPSAFLKAGFHEVARRSPTRPIMRIDTRQRRR